MSNDTAKTITTNIVPVQGIFEPAPTFALVSLIGPAGTPFYPTIDPDQSGLNITNSTINSTTIGLTSPAAAAFTTATVATTPTSATDVANKQYVDYYAAGLSWKEPVLVATTANITLSGEQTIDTIAVVAGDRVLVKDQSTASQNGIYTVAVGSWSRSVGADDWDEYLGAITFVIEGSQAGSAWYCTAQPGGTLGVTAINWANFSVSSTYTAGTGLTLSGTQFSITNTGVSAATYGAANTVPVIAVNAQGQITSATNTAIAINGNQITSGTIGSSYLSGSYSGITGVGTLTNLTVTNTITGSVSGSASSATTATTATNIAGGASGSIPYQTASGTTALLAKGTDGQILALASGLPAWIDNTLGTVTSVSGTGTVSGITLSGTVTSSGSLTLGGSLDLSSPPAIGNATPNTGAFSTLSASSTVSGTGFSNYLASPPAIGGTAANTGAFTTLSASSSVTLSGGTANGVLYLNGSKVATSGSSFVFDGTNVGIGTSSPAYKLHISGSSPAAMVQDTGANASQAFIQATNSGNYFGCSTSGGTTQPMIFYVGAEKMRLDSSGNLGLGVTPSAWGGTYKAMQIGQTAVFGGNASFNRNYCSSNVYWNGTNYKYITSSQATQFEQSDGAYYWLQAASGTAGNNITFTQAMTLDASGNLGLNGITSPQAFFHIGPTSGLTPQIKLGASASYQLQLGYNNSSEYGFLQAYAANLSTPDDIVINPSGGSVGVGVTPNATLQVQGSPTTDGSISFNQQLTSTTAYNSSPQSGTMVSLKYNAGGSYAGMGGWSIAKENATDGNYASYFAIHTRANGGSIAEKARVSAAGGFSVGTTADPGAGAIYATGNITAYYSSDRNLKENIKDVDGALSIVSAIGSKTFDWKDDYIASKGGEDGYFVQKSDFGVIAQDVQEVFPQAVRTREDGTLAVDYEKLSTLAFGAIKELLKRVEALEAK